jgi:hypothetical protein
MRVHHPFAITCLVVIHLAHPSIVTIALGAQSECAKCGRVVARAIVLLPRQPRRVVVLDADNVPPALRSRIEEASAFVTTGEDTVYLKKQAEAFQHALHGPGVWDYVLATIIWHEMAHIDGADEVEAQHQEELLWRQFIVERRIDAGKGLRYLALLRKRR